LSHDLQHWIELGAACLVLSVFISLAFFIMSAKPNDVSDRCATSDQSIPMKKELEIAGLSSKPSGSPLNKKHGRTSRAASPAPALKTKPTPPHSALLFPGGAFEARSPFQVSPLLSQLEGVS
jgi:hypothetical protein